MATLFSITDVLMHIKYSHINYIYTSVQLIGSAIDNGNDYDDIT